MQKCFKHIAVNNTDQTNLNTSSIAPTQRITCLICLIETYRKNTRIFCLKETAQHLLTKTEWRQQTCILLHPQYVIEQKGEKEPYQVFLHTDTHHRERTYSKPILKTSKCIILPWWILRVSLNIVTPMTEARKRRAVYYTAVKFLGDIPSLLPMEAQLDTLFPSINATWVES